MTYSEFLNILSSYAEEAFAAFQKRLIFTKYSILGVRTPAMRKLAKEYAENFEEMIRFPDEYYEVIFIKLTMISALPYEGYLQYLEYAVSLMDDWALCDSFKAKSIARHKEELLPVLKKLFERGGEYEQRYPLVVLLNTYVEEKYLPEIEEFIRGANTQYYYVHMAVAWLIAEVVVKQYSHGITLLQSRMVDAKTHNKAIQKAIESYRLTTEQKELLRSLKIKTNL